MGQLLVNACPNFSVLFLSRLPLTDGWHFGSLITLTQVSREKNAPLNCRYFIPEEADPCVCTRGPVSDSSFPRSEDTDITSDGTFLDSALAKRPTCGFCRRVFQRAEELQEHIHEHAFSMLLNCSQPGHFQCSKCPASFTLKSNMERHEKTIHCHCKKMQCPHCAKLFRDKTDLKRHLLSVHSSERALLCLCCGKGFGTQKSLSGHLKMCSLGSAHLAGSCSQPGVLLFQLCSSSALKGRER
uniref:C2H2-type domain-containing protein n=1 Tax=Junco hyemalis TaxID=40217 RepID=A0A8C5JEK9_JUNHY